MGVLVAGIAIPFAAVAGLGARTVADSMDNLPEELTAEPLAQRTRVLAADGSLLATWYDQNRVNVSLNKVSLVMRKAIVAIEDYRFYQHGALDLKGTLRAFVTNQANSGVVQGGSSITQQMVKQTLINQAKNKRGRRAATADTYERKSTSALRDRLRGEVLQGLDPRALPEHLLLRRRRLRDRGRRAALLLRAREQAQAPPGRPARGAW